MPRAAAPPRRATRSVGAPTSRLLELQARAGNRATARLAELVVARSGPGAGEVRQTTPFALVAPEVRAGPLAGTIKIGPPRGARALETVRRIERLIGLGVDEKTLARTGLAETAALPGGQAARARLWNHLAKLIHAVHPKWNSTPYQGAKGEVFFIGKFGLEGHAAAIGPAGEVTTGWYSQGGNMRRSAGATYIDQSGWRVVEARSPGLRTGRTPAAPKVAPGVPGGKARNRAINPTGIRPDGKVPGLRPSGGSVGRALLRSAAGALVLSIPDIVFQLVMRHLQRRLAAVEEENHRRQWKTEIAPRVESVIRAVEAQWNRDGAPYVGGAEVSDRKIYLRVQYTFVYERASGAKRPDFLVPNAWLLQDTRFDGAATTTRNRGDRVVVATRPYRATTRSIVMETSILLYEPADSARFRRELERRGASWIAGPKPAIGT